MSLPKTSLPDLEVFPSARARDALVSLLLSA